MADTTHERRKRSPHIRRKNLTIDQTKLDRVVQLLEARSEMEAVVQALDLVLFRQELVEEVQRIAGSSGIESFLGDGH